MVSQIIKIKTVEVSSELESFLLEERLIKKLKPKYNIKLTDGKSYPIIKITKKSKFPVVLISRREENDGSIYFGPFTSANSVRIVLKILRRIFPYQAVLNHQNSLCLYNHLGLCPCPSVTNDGTYKNTIKHIIDFLNGKNEKLIKELEGERNKFSKIEDYEKANEIQKKIDAIRLVTSSFYKPFQYEDNPNLRSDLVDEKINNFKEILSQAKVIIKDLKRIECYDISNISGKFATGSMVVFTNGEKDSSSYRRFKIKRDYNNEPNDFGMMREVLERRLRRTEWHKPSLIIVDGGKGQVSAVKDVLNQLKLDIPLIGLAKREEIIITSNLDEIILPKNSKSLLFIMQIRDEAHRFAITYHKKLRSKFIFS